MRGEQKRFSLKWGLLCIVALCWMLPIAAILAVSNYSVTTNIQQRIRETIDTSANYALDRIADSVSAAFDASRAASYDATIRRAYTDYQKSGDHVALYDAVNAYLSRQYAYDNSFRATFLFFTEDPDTIYFANNRAYSAVSNSPRTYRVNAHDEVLKSYPSLGTDIRFLSSGAGLYMMRNIVDNSFKPYAVIIMECDPEVLLGSVRSIVWLESATVWLDDIARPMTGGAALAPAEQDGVTADRGTRLSTVQRSAQVSGHTLRLIAVSDGAALTEEFNNATTLLIVCVLLAIPMLALIVWLFNRSVTRPVNALVGAAAHVEAGERGYQIAETPNSRELTRLTEHFNSMSRQLKLQFDRSYAEQLALQDARIKALRSQINPHFLNNTLEVIAWEARMSKDDKVCRMIEALSTMLGAATARGGAATGTVRQELTYVDAYLYIISERYGERLTIHKALAPETMDALVPCLILQPIVENAIEHGISLRDRGELWLRSRLAHGALILEVEHDGNLSADDQSQIDALLAWDGSSESETADRERIGIRNVNRRIKLMYGETGGLSLSMAQPGRVLARIAVPRVQFSVKGQA